MRALRWALITLALLVSHAAAPPALDASAVAAAAAELAQAVAVFEVCTSDA